MWVKSKLSSMIISVLRTPHIQSSYLEDIDGSWPGTLVSWPGTWDHGLSWYLIHYLCANIELSSMIRSLSFTPQSLKSILGGCWRFLTRVLTDGVLSKVIFHLDRPNLSYPESFRRSDFIWLGYNDLKKHMTETQTKGPMDRQRDTV